MRHAGNRRDCPRANIPGEFHFMERRVAEVQSRVLRTPNHVFASLFRPLGRLKPDYVRANGAEGEIASHFPRIGVLSAHRRSDVTSSYL
jgi:hypothetical protein